MLIKECNKSDALERYAVVAVGSGAITAARKIFENDLIKEKFSLYECESIPLGCGGDVAVGRQKAEERLANDKILCRLICKKVFVVSTLGGGTGTGGAPVIAKYLFDRGMILTNIVTIPFKFEGPAKMKRCQNAINEISQYAVNTEVINNDLCKQHFRGRLGEDYFSNVYSLIEKTILDSVSLSNAPKLQPKLPWYKRWFGFGKGHHLLRK